VGLSVGTTAQLPYLNAVEGVVLAQDPPAHAQGIEGPSINLLVAAASEEGADGFVMPDFTGQPIVAVQTTLERVGLKGPPPTFEDVHVPDVGAPNTTPKPPVAPGSVIAQKPAAGARVDLSTPVILTAAK
jgi:beta-lactam-binding protein with PASTA domain